MGSTQFTCSRLPRGRLSTPGAAVLAAASACIGVSSCERDPMEITHPTPDNLPVEDVRMVVGSGDPPGLVGADLKRWRAVRDSLSQSDLVITIGGLGEIGDDQQDVFGWVTDAKFDAAGNVVVLERMSSEVRVFDRRGRFLTKFGGRGEGPGEFRQEALSLAILSGGRIAVSDRTGRLTVFAPTEDGFVHAGQKEVPVDLWVREGLCQARGRLFLSVWSQEQDAAIYEMPLETGAVATSFGEGYRASSELVRRLLTDGPIGCLVKPMRVVYGIQHFPVLRAYDADTGAALWTAMVADYAQGRIVENRSRGSLRCSATIRMRRLRQTR